MRKAKIIATIGPACDNAEELTKMAKAGVNAFRFNMSHGDYAWHGQTIDIVKEVRDNLGLSLPIIVDTKGPEIRIGTFSNGKVNLKVGAFFTLTAQPIEGSEEMVAITYSKLPKLLHNGDRILVNDGLICLEVVKTTTTDIVTKVIEGGVLSNNKSINIPDVKLNLPYLSLQDRKDINFAVSKGVEYLAISFVRSADDVLEIKDYIGRLGELNLKVISKIECQEGIDNIDEIIKVSDGIMVARGDMGVEIPFERIPQMQKKIIKKCREQGKLVITATEMLESMIEKSRPTRAEISDVANAVLDGTGAVMLSGETSVGRDPTLVIQTMDKIVRECENNNDLTFNQNELTSLEGNITASVALGACSLARASNAKAIIAVTRSGATVTEVSRFRPKTMIIGCTPDEKVFMQLGLVWGVIPILQNEINTLTNLLSDARECAKIAGLVRKGDLVVQTAGQDLTDQGSNMLLINKI